MTIEDLHINHRSIMQSIRVESSIILQRFQELDPHAPDFMIRHLELLDEFIEVGVKPLNLILAYIKEYHPENEELQAEKIETALVVGEVFKLMNEQKAANKKLAGQ